MEDPMLKPLSIIAIALTLLPGMAGAQPLDPYGRPYIMSPPQPTPGDPGYGTAMPMRAPMVAQASPQQALAPDCSGTLRDEYGMMYNCRGDRIDRLGRILPPPVTPPGARALR
jgi:hypothetical protein